MQDPSLIKKSITLNSNQAKVAAAQQTKEMTSHGGVNTMTMHSTSMPLSSNYKVGGQYINHTSIEQGQFKQSLLSSVTNHYKESSIQSYLPL